MLQCRESAVYSDGSALKVRSNPPSNKCLPHGCPRNPAAHTADWCHRAESHFPPAQAAPPGHTQFHRRYTGLFRFLQYQIAMPQSRCYGCRYFPMYLYQCPPAAIHPCGKAFRPRLQCLYNCRNLLRRTFPHKSPSTLFCFAGLSDRGSPIPSPAAYFAPYNRCN